MTDIVNGSVEQQDGATANTVEAQVNTKPAEAAVAAPAEKKDVSIRDAMSSAFDKLSQDDGTKAEKTEGKPTEAKPTAMPPQDGIKPETTPAAEDKPVDPITGRTLEPIKAPVGMPPAIREKWGNLDRQVQQYWVDREKDVMQTLSKTDVERKLAQEFRDVSAPYEPLLRQFNTTATAHAKELFNLSYTLNTGSPQTKAQVIYNLINHFKPDPQTLQQLFSGQPVQAITQAPQPAVDPVKLKEDLKKELAQEQTTTQIQHAWTAFSSDPANEFVSDVQALMGKIMDADLVSGKDYPELFKNAYDLATQQHPEVRQILAQRAAQAAPAASAAAAPTQKPVPQAKPSLNGGSRSKVPQKAVTTREAMELAWAKHSGE